MKLQSAVRASAQVRLLAVQLQYFPAAAANGQMDRQQANRMTHWVSDSFSVTSIRVPSEPAPSHVFLSHLRNLLPVSD